jgi:hypothetical protein
VSYIEDKIKSFGSLEEGWHFGEGTPASQEVINKTIEIYNLALHLACEVFPAIDGGINISFQKEDKFIDFIINSNITIDYIYEIGIGFKYDEIEAIEDISMETVVEKIKMVEL